MGIHGDDVAITIRRALIEHQTAPTISELRYDGGGETGWPNRDGSIVMECIGRDWFRAFRITVEVVGAPSDTAGWDLQTGEWDAH